MVLSKLGTLRLGPVHHGGWGNLPCQFAQWNRRDALVWHQGDDKGERRREGTEMTSEGRNVFTLLMPRAAINILATGEVI